MHRTENIGGRVRGSNRISNRPSRSSKHSCKKWVLPACAADLAGDRWHMIERTRVAPHPTHSRESMRDVYGRHLALSRAGS